MYILKTKQENEVITHLLTIDKNDAVKRIYTREEIAYFIEQGREIQTYNENATPKSNFARVYVYIKNGIKFLSTEKDSLVTNNLDQLPRF